MTGFDTNRVLTGAVQVLIVLLGVSLREAAKAWMADRCGDSTARALGRVSLNPLRHFEPFGTFLLPMLTAIMGGPVFGYGRPVPLVHRNLRHPWRDDLVIAATGPTANIGLAGLAATALMVALTAMGPEAQQTAIYALQLNYLPDASKIATLPNFPLLFTLVQMAYLNAFLAIFHLLPVPPLDGGQIILHLLPPDWATKYDAIRPYGFMIATVLAVLRVVTVLSAPAILLLWIVIKTGD